MGEASPFPSAFALACEATDSASSSPATTVRVTGFDTTKSSSGDHSELPRCCSLGERQGSIGALSQQFIVQRQQEAAAGPRLTIQTTRSLRTTISRGNRRVPRIQEDAEFGGGGGRGAGAPTDAPSTSSRGRRVHTGQARLARACSNNIGMPPRLSKALTAPEGLPDELVATALHGFGGPGSRHATSAGLCSAAAATLPSQAPLLPPPRSGASDSGASRPPLPAISAFATRSQSRSREQQQEQASPASQPQASAYRQLVDAQAAATTAQAQVAGLQHALRRKEADLARLKLELERVSAECDQLQQAVGAAASAAAASAAETNGGQVHTPLHPEAAPRRAAAMGGRGAAHGGAHGRQAPQRGRRPGGLAIADSPEEDDPAASPGLVSAFAGAQRFSFEE